MSGGERRLPEGELPEGGGFTEEQLARMPRFYQAGCTIEQIAEAFGMEEDEVIDRIGREYIEIQREQAERERKEQVARYWDRMYGVVYPPPVPPRMTICGPVERHEHHEVPKRGYRGRAEGPPCGPEFDVRFRCWVELPAESGEEWPDLPCQPELRGWARAKRVRR